MVEKMFAKWMKSPTEFEVISATKALFLKSAKGNARLVTSPKEKGTLFDVETDLQVLPITGRLIKKTGRRAPNYFAYYKGEDSPLKGVSHQIEWSMELQLFMQVFEGIDKFQIEEWDKLPIFVIPKHMKIFERVSTRFGTVILKFLVEIDHTLPYSQSYRYNQRIGLEFVFSSLPNPQKLVGLSELGIPVFQVQAKLSEWTKRDYDEITDENFEEIKEELIKTFQNRNYRLQGKFVNSINTTPENKEKYETLKSYEEQLEYLEKQKKLKVESIDKAKSEYQDTQDLIDQEKIKLDEYKSKNKYYEKLESDNSSLTNKLINANSKLETANDKLKRVNNAGLFKRIFKNW